MPSDSLTRLALDAVADARETFQGAVLRAVAEVESLLADRGDPSADRASRAAAELGPFAAGRLDAAGLAALSGDAESLDPSGREAVGRALEILRAAARAPVDSFAIEVTEGDDPVAAVESALADRGRAFAAARLVDRVRTGRHRPEEDDAGLEAFPFRRWSRAERGIAPPLVVALRGSDLEVGGLGAYLEGAVKIVVVARGTCPPAPLARLVTPGVLVIQTDDAGALTAFEAWDGPAIAAIVPDDAARFVHDPTAGLTPADRIAVEHLPEEDPKGRLGATSAFRQAEDLAHLRDLTASAAPAAPVRAAADEDGDEEALPPADPADRLAAWLLSRADLTGVAEG